MLTHICLTAFLTYTFVGSAESDMSEKAKQVRTLQAITTTARNLALKAESVEELGFIQKLVAHTRKIIDRVLGIGPDLPPPAHYAPAPVAPDLGIEIFFPDKPLKSDQLSNILKKAAEYAGIDSSWATNTALHKLIGQESGFKPGAKNDKSSAFGLFQMLERTWKAFVHEVEVTSNPFWQSVGGLRYIKKVYRTPERAQSFREATLKGDATLAPADLRAKADKWIQKGYKGY